MTQCFEVQGILFTKTLGLRSLGAKILIGLSQTGSQHNRIRCQHNYYHPKQFLINHQKQGLTGGSIF